MNDAIDDNDQDDFEFVDDEHAEGSRYERMIDQADVRGCVKLGAEAYLHSAHALFIVANQYREEGEPFEGGNWAAAPYWVIDEISEPYAIFDAADLEHYLNSDEDD